LLNNKTHLKMAEHKIFATTLDGKNTQYNQVIPYCETNKVRLTIDTTKMAAQVTNLTSWNSVYNDSVNKNLTTKTLRDQRNGLIDTIEEGMREIYNDIPDSLLTDADRNTLNLPKRDTTNTPRGEITTAPFAKAKALEGGFMEFICRTDADNSRASILELADGAELVYNVGGAVPASPSECTQNFFSSKAKFHVKIDPVHAGKKLNGFIRWKNNTDPAKSGPFVFVSAMINA
jgi:hypothetical protein